MLVGEVYPDIVEVVSVTEVVVVEVTVLVVVESLVVECVKEIEVDSVEVNELVVVETDLEDVVWKLDPQVVTPGGALFMVHTPNEFWIEEITLYENGSKPASSFSVP